MSKKDKPTQGVAIKNPDYVNPVNPAVQIAQTWQRVTGLRPGKMATLYTFDDYEGVTVRVVDFVITDNGPAGVSFIQAVDGPPREVYAYLPWNQIRKIITDTDTPPTYPAEPAKYDL